MYYRFLLFSLLFALSFFLGRPHTSVIAATSSATALPVGRTVYKIELNTDGIYRLTYEQLQSAGMDVDTVNPHAFQMLYRGEPVAYELIADTDTTFEAGEAILFYGWKFAGSRHDKMFVNNNVLWLWADGDAPQTIATVPNQNGQAGFTPVNTTLNTVLYEAPNYMNATYTANWKTFPNEPSSLLTECFNKTTLPAKLYSFEISLPHPADATNTPLPDSARYVAELLSLRHPASVTGNTVNTALNGQGVVSKTWDYIQNVNMTGTVPYTSLNSTTFQNTFSVNILTEKALGMGVYKVVVDYWRKLKSDNDLFVFDQPTAGNYLFQISGFSVNTSADARVWDITNPRIPVNIALSSADIIADSNTYTYLAGATASANARYVASNTSGLLTPISITPYQVNDLEPIGGSADWIGVLGQAEFAPELQRLADHRTQNDGLTTHLVDIADIIAQYGYGLPIPSALHDYLQHGYDDWSSQPRYVLLAGDATMNARGLTFRSCFGSPQWTANPQLIPTDFLFSDPHQGLIPSDHTYTLLEGDDLIPDLAIGRFSIHNATELENIIDKILLFEANLKNAVPATTNLTFLSDNKDTGGFFCNSNQTIINTLVPSYFNNAHLCLDTYLTEAKTRTHWEDDFFLRVNAGSLLTNYRGHGAINYWEGNVISTADGPRWLNYNFPTVIVSADCLDGNFAWVNNPSLSETFLRLDQNRGTAAHWSSTGLGYSFEHDALHRPFYKAVYELDRTRIGDAIIYAKTEYLGLGFYYNEAVSFTLQGDPAMLLKAAPATVAIPSPFGSPAKGTADILAGGISYYSITVTNLGTAEDRFTVTGVTDKAWIVAPVSTGPLAPGESVTIQLPIVVPVGVSQGTTTVLSAEVQSATIDSRADYPVYADLTVTGTVPTAIALTGQQTEIINRPILLLLVATLSLVTLTTRHLRRQA